MPTFHHITTFVLTFTSYALFHATRKAFSNVKSTISQEWSQTPGGNGTSGGVINIPYKYWNDHHMFGAAKDAETYLGVLDAVFMISYAVGLFISGILGDRFELRKVLSLGMCTTGITVFIFGSVLEWNHFYNKYLYVGMWIINGLLQSSGWPTVVAVMGNWFGKSSRGLVLGLWSACASVGNIIGALMVSQVLHYGYDFAFLVTSTVLFAGGIINFFGIVNSPKDIGLKSPDDELTQPDVQITIGHSSSGDHGNSEYPGNHGDLDDTDDDTDPLLGPGSQSTQSATETGDVAEALSFWKALCLPGVLLYSLSYFCLKLVNYSFFFWLPYYLSNAFGWKESTADKISIWYDIGGIVGGTIAGLISDCFQRRSVVVIPMLFLAIPALFGYSNSPNDMTINAVLMTITGFFIGGVSNLISAAIAADLGKQGPVQGNKQALATVTGIVDGTGSVGAALGQILVPIIQTHIGWHFVFYLFIVMTLLTIASIFPMFIRELPLFIKDIRHSCSKYRYSWYRGLHVKDARRQGHAEATSVNGDTADDGEQDLFVQG